MERTEAQQLQSNVLTYNKASWKNETSLYALNSAQQGVIAAGALACMYYCGLEVVAGSSLGPQHYTSSVRPHALVAWFGVYVLLRA